MFRISTEGPEDRFALAHQVAGDEATALAPFCIVDEWSADLDNATLHIGPEARAYHGLDPAADRFGILDFVRCYEPADASEIVNVFERAAAHGLPFHYSAELRSKHAAKHLVHCFGQCAQAAITTRGASLRGVFMMSRHRFQGYCEIDEAPQNRSKLLKNLTE